MQDLTQAVTAADHKRDGMLADLAQLEQNRFYNYFNTTCTYLKTELFIQSKFHEKMASMEPTWSSLQKSLPSNNPLSAWIQDEELEQTNLQRPVSVEGNSYAFLECWTEKTLGIVEEKDDKKKKKEKGLGLGRFSKFTSTLKPTKKGKDVNSLTPGEPQITRSPSSLEQQVNEIDKVNL